MCFRCTDKGHFAYQCRNPISCFACNRFGHKAFQCRAITEMQPKPLEATPIETLPMAKPISQVMSDPIKENLTSMKSIRTFHSTPASEKLDETLRMSFLLDDDEQWGMVRVQRALCRLIPRHEWVVRISRYDIHIEIEVDENRVEQAHSPNPQRGETKDGGSTTGSGSRPQFKGTEDKTVKEPHMVSNGADVVQTNEIETQIEMGYSSGTTYEFKKACETELEKRATSDCEWKTDQSTNTVEITTSDPGPINVMRMGDSDKVSFKEILKEIDKENEESNAKNTPEQLEKQYTDLVLVEGAYTTALKNLTTEAMLEQHQTEEPVQEKIQTELTPSHHLLLIGGSNRHRRSLRPQVAFFNRAKKTKIESAKLADENHEG